jgi:predicted ATP-grasp superfamily ATP-dependent carboligase
VAKPLAATSRYCRGTLIYPDPAAKPDAFLAWLEDLGRKQPQTVLMPMTDLTVPLVLQAGSPLGGLLTALPALSAYETVSDKYQLFKLAQKAAVRAPETRIVSQQNIATLADSSLKYPLVVKPRRSAERSAAGVTKRPVRYAQNAPELAEIARAELLHETDELLVQQYVSGFGAGVFGLYDRGQPLFFFSHRRIREKPPSGGISVLCESTPLPEEGVAATRRLLESLQWHGVAMVEFKIDSAGRTWLIEINARFWGSLQLAVDCGADFPWLLYQIATGASPAVPPSYAVGERLRWWLGDLDNLYARLRDPRWTPTLLHKTRALGEFLRPWQPRTRYEFMRWSDPGPAAAALGQYLTNLTHSRRKAP